MKKNEVKNLREQTLVQLKKEVDRKRKEKALIWAKIKAGKEKNTAKVKLIRRDLAQLLTVIREKEIIEKLSEDKKKS